jgi:pimeloyl-ACP methyl ester carboxylesterase
MSDDPTTRTANDSPTRYLTRPHGRLAYDVQGPADGGLVVCIPGMGDVRQVYRFAAAALVAAGLRVATFDLRGHGDSDATFDCYDDPAAATDAIALIEELGGPAVLIGNSMGSAAAVIAAAEHPELVKGLVLTGPFVRNPPINPVLAFVMRVALMRPWGLAGWMSYHASLYPGRRPADFAEYRARLRDLLKRPAHWKAFIATTRQVTHEPARLRLGDVDAPTLVVMGSKDRDFKDPAAEGAFVREALSGELLMVDGAGHYPIAQYPDVVSPRIVAFTREAFAR